MRLEVTIPGPPHAQQRGKAARWRARDGREGLTVRDPAASRSWKGMAQIHMHEAGGPWPGFTSCETLTLSIEAVFPCPTSQYRKTTPVPRRRACGSRNDCDNLAKAVMDAGNGVLWLDDGQIAVLHVEKWIGAQGEAPYVKLTVEELASSDIVERIIPSGGTHGASECVVREYRRSDRE